MSVFIDSKGQLGTLNSSRRFKQDIRDMDEASRRLYELRPVTFQYRRLSGEEGRPLEYGLIAEEVAKVYPDLVAYDAHGQIEAVQYHKLTPMLLNKVQRLAKLLHAESDKNNEVGKLLQVERDKNLAQGREVANLQQQMVAVQAHVQRMEALAVRLNHIEAVEAERSAGRLSVTLSQ